MSFCRDSGTKASLGLGAEILVLEDGRGVVAVSGSAEVDGDDMG